MVVYDFDSSKAQKLKNTLEFPVTIVENFDALLALNPKVIVEAASQQAAKDYVPKIVATGIELIVMSTGALLDLNVNLGKVHVPSGAIGGLDAISSASLAGIDEVVLTSRKNPKAFGSDSKEEKVMYEGYCGGSCKKISTGNECSSHTCVNS